MAVCEFCKQQMRNADGCTNDLIVIAGKAYQPVRWGSEPGWRADARCGDCNVLRGSVHHHGCDIEECPACGRQSITCGCMWAGEEHLSEFWVEEMEERLFGS